MDTQYRNEEPVRIQHYVPYHVRGIVVEMVYIWFFHITVNKSGLYLKLIMINKAIKEIIHKAQVYILHYVYDYYRKSKPDEHLLRILKARDIPEGFQEEVTFYLIRIGNDRRKRHEKRNPEEFHYRPDKDGYKEKEHIPLLFFIEYI